MPSLPHRSNDTPLAAWRLVLAGLLSVAALPACEEIADGEPDPATLPPPTPPGTADDPYSIEGLPRWSLVGDGLTADGGTVEVEVRPPAGTRYVDLWLDDVHQARVRKVEDRFRTSLDLRGVAPGEHVVLATKNGGRTAFAQVHFTRSYPLYVAVTNDWDDPDNPDASLRLQERLHENHPGLKLTHFVGPYTFTDPTVAPERAAELVAWLQGLRETQGDEIGLHIHPYCSFVASAGVTCRTSPSFAYASGDDTGYTVFLSSYSREETRTLLRHAVALFEEHGLGRPTTFRAGGWTAELHTLQALADEGFVADSSGCNWRRLEEWRGYPGAALYDWNQEHWVTIGDTSQPYYPSASDLLADTPPVVATLEVPDNAILVDYVTAAEMIEIFEANWPGGALERPTTYVFGYHPPNFDESYFARLDPALEHIDRFLAADDRGPAVYVTLRELPLAWPIPADVAVD
jgi:hypothetical protein